MLRKLEHQLLRSGLPPRVLESAPEVYAAASAGNVTRVQSMKSGSFELDKLLDTGGDRDSPELLDDDENPEYEADT